MNSEKNELNMHVEDLNIWFRKRGYPGNLIKEQVKKALRLNSKKVNGASLVFTQHLQICPR